MEDCETGLPANTRWRTEEGNQELQSDCTQQCRVEAVCVLCVVMRMEKEKEPET